MNDFYMMIGLPGSGKSTVAKSIASNTTAVIISSDEIRAELFGKAEIQENTGLVFQTMFNRTKDNLNMGNSVIYDATNLHSKQRRHLLSMLPKCKKIAVLVLTPYTVCLERNKSRERVVPENVIRNMYLSFQTPNIGEGFDEVQLKYTDVMQLPFSDIIDMNNIPQDSSYHTATIGEHMKLATDLYIKDTSNVDNVLLAAIRMHDIGKPFTKSFINTYGVTTPEAHYYNHNNVGAYNSFFYSVNDFKFEPQEKINIALLIQYHMNYYMAWKDSIKAEARDRILLGPYLTNLLDMLHKYDLLAH